MICLFRRTTQRLARELAPLTLSLATLALVGLGSRLADQWHRHEGPGAGFTHLHMLVGDHLHDDDRPGRGRREPSPPSPDGGSCGVVTFSLGVATAVEPPAAIAPTAPVGEHRIGHLSAIGDSRLDREPWSPRAPPV
ncbi:MAG: hypothetical protein V2I67_01680 [Thermoanaerobaculales bacterium]|jgi:hypothetical protein|nr:hypothetical protein [Thermoanaerobaculales bacterium]